MIGAGATVTAAAFFGLEDAVVLTARDRPCAVVTGTLIWGLSPVRLRGATGAMIGVEATVSGAAVMWIGRYSRLDGEGQTQCGRDRGAELGSVPGEAAWCDWRDDRG